MFGHLSGEIFVLVANVSNKLRVILALESMLRGIFIEQLELLEVDEESLEAIIWQDELLAVSSLQILLRVRLL